MKGLYHGRFIVYSIISSNACDVFHGAFCQANAGKYRMLESRAYLRDLDNGHGT